MELCHRLVRQAINRAVSKGMEDMAGNTGRGVRKLIDLGQMFSQTENQRWFFNTAQEVVSNPRNSYNKLMLRVLADIDGETVKTVGLNLGYSSLIYGARRLQRQQKLTDEPLPWILFFDLSDSAPADFAKMEELILASREKGIYSYVFCLREPGNVAPLCAVAEKFGECFFAFLAPPRSIEEQAAVSLGALHNAVVCIEVPGAGFAEEGCARAFRLLRDRRCFCGFYTSYQEEDWENVACPEYVREAISAGSIFGVFHAGEGVSDSCRTAVYDFTKKERNGEGLPLVAFEWECDLEEISRRIHVPAGCRFIREVSGCVGTAHPGESGR